MKGTEQFKEIIKNYLDNRAKEDELFRAKYETTERTIDDVVTYILNEVKQSGCCGFSDMEVFSMAVHAIDELTLEIGKPVNCDVVVNRHIDLTEEEKAQFVEGYLSEGDFGEDDSIKIFPVAKSTELMFLNETDWEKFARATGAAYDDLSTVEGLVATAGAYYDWPPSAQKRLIGLYGTS